MAQDKNAQENAMQTVVEMLDRLCTQMQALTTVVRDAVESPAHRRDRIATALLSSLLVNTGCTNPVREAVEKAVDLTHHLDRVEQGA